MQLPNPLKFINLQNTGKKVHDKRSKLSMVSLTSQSNKTQDNAVIQFILIHLPGRIAHLLARSEFEDGAEGSNKGPRKTIYDSSFEKGSVHGLRDFQSRKYQIRGSEGVSSKFEMKFEMQIFILCRQ
jgi:hypothetical protein